MERLVTNAPVALRAGLDLAIKLFAVLAAVAAADFFTLQSKVTSATQVQEAVDTAKLQSAYSPLGLPKPVEATVVALQDELLSPPANQSTGTVPAAQFFSKSLSTTPAFPSTTMCAGTTPPEQFQCLLSGISNQSVTPLSLPAFPQQIKPKSFCELYGDEVKLIDGQPCNENQLPPQYERLLLMNNQPLLQSAGATTVPVPAPPPTSKPQPQPGITAPYLQGDDLVKAAASLKKAVYEVLTLTVTNNGRGVASSVKVSPKLPNLKLLAAEQDTFALGSGDKNLVHFFDPSGLPFQPTLKNSPIRVENSTKDSALSIRYRRIAFVACLVLVALVAVFRLLYDKPPPGESAVGGSAGGAAGS